MSAPQTQYAPTQSSSVLGGQIVGRSERQAAPPAALKLRLDLNLEVEIAIQAKVNGDITLSLLAVSELIVVLNRTGRLASCESSVLFNVLLVDGDVPDVLFLRVALLSNPFLTNHLFV
ncbi:hypothetical protein EDD18DRAFT_1353130 [Armillaria luteobubalina]|uniref:Uncharacterized protein n=1 Tax=Armillaria luteobubalina TaxID=153913 RepID=A0AA39Q517_9AGAR|nr:hypothetical protein EDD18DRAFT_1353130 [Armillaria luteobubalina]